VCDLVIRSMLAQDVPAVSAIDRLCFPCPWSEEAFRLEIAGPVGYYQVAELRGDIVGYFGSQIILDEAHITTFGVHPSMRRRRIGERLLLDFLHQAVRSGCRRITLEVRESNSAARGLYEKYGFLPVSRRRRYYTDNDEDAIVMWIEDTTRLSFLARLTGIE
jgi:[ribosomal protein S18]-alanine N-acetyltransferase